MKQRIRTPVLAPKQVPKTEMAVLPSSPSPPPTQELSRESLVPAKELVPTTVVQLEAPKGWTSPILVSPVLLLGIGVGVFLMAVWIMAAKMEVHRLSMQQHELMTAVLQTLRAH